MNYSIWEHWTASTKLAVQVGLTLELGAQLSLLDHEGSFI